MKIAKDDVFEVNIISGCDIKVVLFLLSDEEIDVRSDKNNERVDPI